MDSLAPWLWLALALLAGVATGTLTGLIPGLHVNVVAAILLAFSASLQQSGVPLEAVIAYIVATAVVQCFLDIVPSVFLGVPASEELALLPVHRLAREGRGLEAVYLSLVGSWGGLVGSLSLGFAFWVWQRTGLPGLQDLEDGIRPFLASALSVIAVLLILSDRHRGWAATVFTISGLYGLLLFASPIVPGGADAAFGVLFPALSGLFGLSGLCLSLKESSAPLPPQRVVAPLDEARWRGAAARGTVGGMLVGLLPGLGAANVATLFELWSSWRGAPEREDAGKDFIVTTSAINVSDTLFGVAALVLLQRARSGASAAVEQLMIQQPGQLAVFPLLEAAAVALLAGAAARGLLLRLGPSLARSVSRMSHRGLALAVTSFISVMVWCTTGYGGILVLVGTTLLGMIAPLVHVRRAQAMGLFLVPAILYYSGWQAPVVSALGLDGIALPAPDVDLVHLVRSLGLATAAALVSYRLGK